MRKRPSRAHLLGTLVSLAAAGQAYAQPLLHFERSPTEVARGYDFGASYSGHRVALSARSIVIDREPTSGESLRIQLVDADGGACLEGLNRLPGASHYYVGSDPSRWRTNVAHYGRVRYGHVYPGIDMEVHGVENGLIEYDFIVAPGASPGWVELRYSSSDELRCAKNGGLLFGSGDSTIVQRPPRAYQDGAEGRHWIEVHLVQRAPRSFGFQVADYDVDRPLVIDPVVEYSTFLGGSESDSAFDIAVDDSLSAYVTGGTNSVDYPTRPVASSSPEGDVIHCDQDESRRELSCLLDGHRRRRL